MSQDQFSLFSVEKRRYAEKGWFLIPALFLWICFFVFLPSYGKDKCGFFQILFAPNLISLTYVPFMSFFHIVFAALWFCFFNIGYRSKNKSILFWRTNKTAQWPWEKDEKEWLIQKWKTIHNLCIHHLIMFPILLLADTFIGLKYKSSCEDFPSIGEFILQIVFFMIMEDFGFFWGHYALHSKFLYSRLHKQHHEYTSPFTATAEYSHPLEYIFGNLIPSTLGVKLLGNRVHIFTVFVWMFWRMYTTSEVHSGFEVPFSPVRIFPFSGGAHFHDFHHSHNVGAYGSYFTLWDRLMKTDRDFLIYKSKKELKSE